MSRSIVPFMMCMALVACGGSPAPGAATAGGERASTTDPSPGSTPPDDAVPQPVEGSPECEGCVYSSSPGHPDASGRGGIAEWCQAGDPMDGHTCPMSCCRTARGG